MILRLFLTFVITFIISFCGLQMIGIFSNLEPGESIGQDWYLIKSYEEFEKVVDGKVYTERTIKHGEGPINVSFIVALVVSGLYLLFKGIGKKRNIGDATY